MTLLLEQFLPTPAGALLGSGVCVALWFGGYVIYRVYFHPLARFPGPFLASVTDIWQAYQILTLKQPYNLTELHAKYGQFVRYGPDKLSITAEDAIPLIYQKGGRVMPKTEFYDAFGGPAGTNPNTFGMRDEERHSIRRPHMSHSFSISYVKEMEKYLDENVLILRNKIAGYADRGETFNLKQLIQSYVIDVLGELAFSQSFGIQVADDESMVPPVVEHTLFASTIGAWPAMTSTLKKWLPKIPRKGMQTLFKARAACASLASRCVKRRIAALEEEKANGTDEQRKDILTNLILAKDPETGENLTQSDLETEAFGFIIAGTHTTTATTTLLFWNLLHNPDVMDRCVEEVVDKLPDLSSDKVAYSVTEVEASLPFLRQCVRENFRSVPVFTMPLPRRVMAPEGIVVAGERIPQGTSVAVCNHAFHHDPEVWGADHNVFDPSRWEEAENAKRARYLMHFGLGGRQCIGKTVAQTNIYKLASTLLREFDFDLADAEEREAVSRGDFRGILPPLISVGISDLEGPLMVTAERRNATKGQTLSELDWSELPNRDGIKPRIRALLKASFEQKPVKVPSVIQTRAFDNAQLNKLSQSPDCAVKLSKTCSG
ncbi:isotrichodermin C-15 hydroxylase [Diaporthe helianthi]|uniref:Isotrichodermin C-15 hydroxylase n=1 Tax=Diaporthe helianthi TaxID=158607 RepID=A0A2P5HHN7_DIAHE|nr:isotrichodermin C-15 hydroxylase [Diaporthe helianthi]